MKIRDLFRSPKDEEDLFSRNVVWASIALVAFVAIMMIFSAGLESEYDRQQTHGRGEVPDVGVPQPGSLDTIETSFETGYDVKRLNAEKLQDLRTYRWVDRQRGIVAIPVEEAMQAVVRSSQSKPKGVSR